MSEHEIRRSQIERCIDAIREESSRIQSGTEQVHMQVIVRAFEQEFVKRLQHDIAELSSEFSSDE